MSAFRAYEPHKHPDPQFPIIFHFDTVTCNPEIPFEFQWHEDVELLFGVEGEGTVISNTERLPLRKGELCIVNSNHIHRIYSDGICRYYCLIPDGSLCPGWDAYGEKLLFQSHLSDEKIQKQFESIIREMEEGRPYYKSVVKSQVTILLAELCRNYMISPAEVSMGRRDNRIDLVKSAIRYLQNHYSEEISIEDICSHIGFSKYYFCHTFKEITGSTVIHYLNFIRCQNARSLLATGKYNVSECAELSGFHNMSYFTRIYKKQLGILPSRQKEEYKNTFSQ
ncbi:MAG: AraC family transcriptional regulator [Fusicatenibacter sp.]|nr:AraC family transcriptional regulator [Fusicatenibacter sp.]